MTDNIPPPAPDAPMVKWALYSAKIIGPVFACQEYGKGPATTNGSRDATTDPEIIRAMWAENPNFNIGCAPDRVNCYVLDQDGLRGAETLASLELEHGMLPATRICRTPRGPSYLHYWFRGRTTNSVGTDKRGLGPKLDTRGYPNGYVLLPPSRVHYEDGSEGRYEWVNDAEPAPGPTWIAAELNRGREEHAAASDVELDSKPALERADALLRRYVESGDVAVSGSGGNNRTYELACEVLNLGLKPATAFDRIKRIWNVACEPPWDDDELANIVVHASEYMQNELGAWAVAPGSETFAEFAASQPKHLVPAENVAPPAEMISGASPYSDAELSNYFATCQARRLRYDLKQKKWFGFRGDRWVEMAETTIWNIMKPHHLQLAQYCDLKKAEKKSICDKKTFAAVESLSRGHPKFAVTSEIWDTDPFMLNTPGGIVDLRTGDMRPAVAEDYCTKSTAVTPDFKADCPRWRNFLSQVTDKNERLQIFLQQWFGYCLSGSIDEQKFLFAHGIGNNGKGVFFSTLRELLHDYAVTAPANLLMQSRSERHPTEIAMLKGARLATMQETQRDAKWDEGKLKELTGGDRLSGRWMRGDFFDFMPQFKLMLSGNKRPQIDSTGEAMRRRLLLVPFTVVIPEAKRDAELPQKLKDEWPAILAWAIAGCVDWQLTGLCAPPAVKEASREYFEDENPLTDWLTERCIRDPEAWTTTADLYQSYCRFALLPAHLRDSRKTFGQRLEDEGFKRRKRDVHGYLGIALKELPEDAQEVPT